MLLANERPTDPASTIPNGESAKIITLANIQPAIFAIINNKNRDINKLNKHDPGISG